MKEEFIDIPGYELHYKSSNLGNIKSIKFGKEKILKKQINKDGYEFVYLFKEGKGKNSLVHRLVMYAFEGVLPLEVNHIDKNKRNNKLNNLEYCTKLFNLKHQRDC